MEKKTQKVLERKDQPQSLSEFQENTTIKHNNAKTLSNKNNNIPTDKNNVKTLKRNNVKNLNHRITVYFSEEGVENLETARFMIRKMMPIAIRKKISKSLIIEEAINIIMEDFNNKKANSEIVKKLIQLTDK